MAPAAGNEPLPAYASKGTGGADRAGGVGRARPGRLRVEDRQRTRAGEYRDDVLRPRPALGLLGHHHRDQVVDDPRHLDGVADPRDGRGGVLVDHRRRGAAGVGGAPGEHLVEDTAQRVDVARRTDLATRAALGREVAEAPDDVVGGGQPLVAQPSELGDPEVDDPDPAVAVVDEVGRLDVAVDDPLAVDGGERTRGLDDDLAGLPGDQRAVRAQAFAEVGTGQELHDEEGHRPVAGALDPGVVDLHGPGVAGGRGRERLPTEPLDHGRVGRRPHDLDRDPPLQGEVHGLPYLAHTASPDQAVQLITAGNLGVGGGLHGGRSRRGSSCSFVLGCSHNGLGV
ncbi:ribosomal large subunit pseudouridine synthase B [Nocardioidaceae bacterium Broad-1]|nr:ribosomal large subunit pseudouridine synthase B [Nocardioidaceae bacterium Broad-1]